MALTRTRFAQQQLQPKDERTGGALFGRFVPKGVYEYTYFAQATMPGEFKLAPAMAYDEYFPEVWGRSDGGTFVVAGDEEGAGGDWRRPGAAVWARDVL